MLNVNIIVVNLYKPFRLYSPDNLDNVYLLLFQDQDQRYHAIKYQPTESLALSNQTGFISIIESNQPIIQNILKKIFN